MGIKIYNDQQTEQAVIGCILNKGDLMTEAIGYITKEDFYHIQHSTVYEAMETMYKHSTPIDVITVSKELGKEKLELIGGVTYLSKLMTSVETTLNYKSYLSIIKKLSNKRKVVTACHELIESAKEETEVEVLVNDLQNKLLETTNEKSNVIDTEELMEMTINRIVELQNQGGRAAGISTGYRQLDLATGGFHKGQLTIIAGRPSMGKTAFALNLIRQIEKGNNVLLFELEMTPEQVGTRILASDSRVMAGKLAFGKVTDTELNKTEESAKGFTEKGNIFICDKPEITMTEVRAIAKKVMLQKGLSVLMIDHIGLMTPENPKLSKNEQIGIITAGLKRLARELKISVVALSQLNRGVEQRPNKRPMMSDLRDSGNIEQDADVIMLLYRDDYYNKPEVESMMSLIEIKVAKNRDGETGDILMNYYLPTQLIDE